MNITSALNDKSVVQAFGTGVRYQFLDNKLGGIHAPVFCRDCIQLVVWSEITGKSVYHQGFRYTAGAMEFPRKRFKIAVDYIMANNQQDWKEEEVQKMKLILHYFEDKMEVERSSLKLKNNNKFILIESSSKWLQRPYLTSLYTLLIRYSLKYGAESMEEFIVNSKSVCSDGYYLRVAKELVQLILNGGEIDQIYDDYVTAELAFHNSGLVGASKKLKNNENIPA